MDFEVRPLDRPIETEKPCGNRADLQNNNEEITSMIHETETVSASCARHLADAAQTGHAMNAHKGRARNMELCLAKMRLDAA
jgi:hypothetical protein